MHTILGLRSWEHSWLVCIENSIIHGLLQIRPWRQGSYHRVATIVHNILDDFLGDILE